LEVKDQGHSRHMYVAVKTTTSTLGRREFIS